MFSIFRKLKKHPSGEVPGTTDRRAGQFGRFLLYAIGEVLLAPQVDNWNEARKQRREELELLKALKTALIYPRNEIDTIAGTIENT